MVRTLKNGLFWSVTLQLVGLLFDQPAIERWSVSAIVLAVVFMEIVQALNTPRKKATT